MKISKKTSEDVAKKLLSKKFDEHIELSAKFSTAVRNEYIKTLPNEVLDFYSRFPEYTRTTDRVKIIGNGFNHEFVNVVKVPCCIKGYNEMAILQPNERTAESLLKAKNKFVSAREFYFNSIQKVEAVIYKLGSYARIKEQFPEAVEFLPVIEKAEIMNIKEIRNLLK